MKTKTYKCEKCKVKFDYNIKFEEPGHILNMSCPFCGHKELVLDVQLNELKGGN